MKSLLTLFLSFAFAHTNAQDYFNYVLRDIAPTDSTVSALQIPFTSRPDTSFVGVFGFGKDTILMTFECNIGITPMTLFDSIYAQISQSDSFYPPKDMNRIQLYGSRKLTQKLKERSQKYYYVYGTKGYMKCDIGTALYYSGPCVCFYGFMLRGYDRTKCGDPLFTYPSMLPISYGGDYKKIQAALNKERDIVLKDTTGAFPYIDKIYPTVFASIGLRYFVYSDTFGGDCRFPERMIYDMSADGKHVTLTWYSEPDFFGSACD